MRTTRLVLLWLACLTAGAACRNAAGRRVTLWEWVHSRNDAQETADAQAAPPRVDGDDPGAPGDGVGSEGVAGRAAPSPTNEPADDGFGRTRTVALTSAGGGLPPAEVASGVRLPSQDAIHSDALIVDDETISVDDILEPILPTIRRLSEELGPATYYQRVVEMVHLQIIESVAQHLIWRRAQSRLNEDLEPRIEKAIDKVEKERIHREFNGSETRYEKYLAGQDKSRSEVRRRLRRAIIIDAYLHDHLLPLVAAPRKQELLRYYQSHAEAFSKPARREMLLIDVPIAAFLDPKKPLTKRQRDEATAKARQAIQDAAEALKAGDTFEHVAGKYSHGVNRAKGGAWGFISGPLQGRWAEPSRRVFEMKPSETSEIIESHRSFFIVKVGKVEGGTVASFQDAQPRIANLLRQERFAQLRKEFLQREWEQSTIGSVEAFVSAVLKAVPPPKKQ